MVYVSYPIVADNLTCVFTVSLLSISRPRVDREISDLKPGHCSAVADNELGGIEGRVLGVDSKALLDDISWA